MNGKRLLEWEMYKAEKALSELDNIEVFKVLDPMLRLLRLFVMEAIDFTEMIQLIREANSEAGKPNRKTTATSKAAGADKPEGYL